ncbi:HEAT repeat domain-containing protein [bacterium]|nr:HEAT repeat domain-containing protein [bacterium]
MFNNKSKSLILTLGVLLIFSSSSYEQNKSPKEYFPRAASSNYIWTEEEAIYWLSKQFGTAESGGLIDGLLTEFNQAGQTIESLENPEKLIKFVIDFPTEDDALIAAKIGAVINFPEYDYVKDFVLKASQDGGTHTTRWAAQAYVWWRDWEHARPLLQRCGEYHQLQMIAKRENNLAEIVITDLREDLRTVDWKGKANIGYALRAYGDSTAFNEIMIDILLNALEDNSKGAAIAKHLALSNMHSLGIVPVDEIVRLANDDNQLVRFTALDALNYFMKNGYETARIALERISESNDDSSVRENAVFYLEELKNKGEEE